MKTKNKPLTGKKVLLTSHRAAFGNSFNRPLIQLLKRMGAEVHYAANGEVPVEYCDKVYTIPIQRSPFSIKNVAAYRELKKIIESEKYNLVHCHTPTGGVLTRLAARKARDHGTFVMYTAHGFHFFKGAPLLNWLLFYPIEKFLASHTDELITINKEDFVRARDNFKTQVSYVPGVGLDRAKFPKLSGKQRDALRESMKFNTQDFVIIYPAELSVRKRQMWLIETMGDLLHNNQRIHLLLPGMDSLNGRCQKLTIKLGLAGQVHFLGLRSDVPQLLAASDLAISTSSQEGLPVNIMEAICTGLPVVATDCRGNTDLVADGENGFIVPKEDGRAFVSRVRQVYEEGFDKEKLEKHNKSMISKYLLPNVLFKMARIYQRHGSE